MFTKFGKEKTLFKNSSFRVKYGTIDARTLKAIYIDIESWVEPQSICNFDSQIRLNRTKLISNIKKKLDTSFFNENFIVDLDLRSSGMMLNKKSFMLLEITLYPKSVVKFNSEILKEKIHAITGVAIDTIKENNYTFNSNKRNETRRTDRAN